MDGNYASSFDIRFKYADTIIYLGYPTILCFWRVIKRIVKYYGKVRSDMQQGCKERFDLEFLYFVATFNYKNRTGIIEKLNLIKNEKKVYILKTDKAADLCLGQIAEMQ